MSQRPIKLTPEMMKDALAQLEAKLQKFKCFDGKVTFESDAWEYPATESKVRIEFSELAMKKQNRLVDEFSTEVAWHGFVERDPNDPLHFVITDIVVFPQKVTGVTVQTDTDKYNTWIDAFDDETFYKIRYHGHSHVNMGTTPSGVDNQYQEDILSQLTGDDFYIFLIWNKRGECTPRVFDLATNTMYDDKDVEIIKPALNDDLSAFIQDAKSKVASASYNYANTYPSVYAASATTPKEAKEKSKNKKGSHISAFDDDDYGYGGYGGNFLQNANWY